MENWPSLWTCIVLVFGRTILLKYLGSLSRPSLWTWKLSPNGVIRVVDGPMSVQLELVVIHPLWASRHPTGGFCILNAIFTGLGVSPVRDYSSSLWILL